MGFQFSLKNRLLSSLRWWIRFAKDCFLRKRPPAPHTNSPALAMRQGLLEHNKATFTFSLTRRAFLKGSFFPLLSAFAMNFGNSHVYALCTGTTSGDPSRVWTDFLSTFPATILNGSGTQLALDPSRLLISFEGELKISEVQQLLSQANPDLEVENIGNGQLLHDYFRPGLRINHLPDKVWIRSKSNQPVSSITTVSELFSANGHALKWVGPAYRLPGTIDQVGVVCALPNVISVRPAQTANLVSLDADLFQQFHLVLAKQLTQYLAGYRYYYLPDAALLLPTQASIYCIQQELSKQHAFTSRVSQANLDFLPLILPAQATFSPNDPLYRDNGQWNASKTAAKAGWESGAAPIVGNDVVIAVIDHAGVQYSHEDFQDSLYPTFIQGATFSGQQSPPAINDNSLSSPPAGGESDDDAHGTNCAGVIAARYNTKGIAGLAGRCKIMSIRVVGYQAHLVAAAINYASGEGAPTSAGTRHPATPANVISMSFVGEPVSMDYLNTPEIQTALAKAFVDHKVVLCGASGDSGRTPPYYPAADPHVIACGSSNQDDDRCHQVNWGSNSGSTYGGQLSVIAPGNEIRTTDLLGLSGKTSGDYAYSFGGTSASAPHVAALAGLLMAKYPSLKNDPNSTRAIIERTAEKVGRVTLGAGCPPADIPSPSTSLAYSNTTGKYSGDWNQETGYGRINIGRALTFADVMIKKHPSDIGLEPFTPPGNDFGLSDIVLSTADDVTLATFDSRNTPGSKQPVFSVPYYLFIRVTNRGPEVANGVTVSVRITKQRSDPFTIGDWTAGPSGTHLKPQEPSGPPQFSAIPSGSQALAKFLMPVTDVAIILSWIASAHTPCALAQVISQNDYAFSETRDWTPGDLLLRKNNLTKATLRNPQTPPSPPQNLRVS